MRMKNKIGAGLLAGLLMVAGLAAAETVEWQRVACPEGGFTIELPPAWKTICDLPGLILAAASPQEGSDDKFIENLTIVTAPNVPPRTIEDFYYCYLLFLPPAIDGYEFVSCDSLRVDGRAGRKLVFLYNLGSERVKVMQVMFIKGEQVFILTFADKPDTFDQREADFDRMTDSLKFD